MIAHLNCYLLAYSSDLISFGDGLEHNSLAIDPGPGILSG